MANKKKDEVKKMSEANIGTALITFILCLTILLLAGYIVYHF